MKAVILQSNYLPWKGYFDLIYSCDVFCFYDEVKYTKNDWRNRNKIVDKNGAFWLTIPITKEAVKQKISQVLLPNSNWKEQHLESIKNTYKRSPNFSSFFPVLESNFSKNIRNLSEFNQNLIREICNYIGIKTKIIDSKGFQLSDGKVERLLALLKQMDATEYISGPAGKNYLADNLSLFESEGIQVEFKFYNGYKTYPQNSSDFNHFVSIIDTCMMVEQNEILNYILNVNNRF